MIWGQNLSKSDQKSLMGGKKSGPETNFWIFYSTIVKGDAKAAHERVSEELMETVGIRLLTEPNRIFWNGRGKKEEEIEKRY